MADNFPADITLAAVESCRATGIPASVTLAQWALESAYGRHASGKNNYFGIKAVAGQAATTRMTHEFVNGAWTYVPQRFADYPTVLEGFNAHGHLLATGKPYARARAVLPDAEAFARALTGVYATDPAYGSKLISIMRAGGLEKYDVAARVATSVVSKPITTVPPTPAASPVGRLDGPRAPQVSTPADMRPDVQLTAKSSGGGLLSWLRAAARKLGLAS